MEKAAYKVNKSAIATRNSYYNALITLLVDYKKTFSKISVTEISKLANRDRKVFYHYFSNIKEIYTEMKNMFLNNLIQQIPNQINKSDLGNVIGNIIFYIDNCENICKLLVSTPYSEEIIKSVIFILKSKFNKSIKFEITSLKISYHLYGCFGMYLKAKNDKRHFKKYEEALQFSNKLVKLMMHY